MYKQPDLQHPMFPPTGSCLILFVIMIAAEQTYPTGMNVCGAFSWFI